ncbi:MAG: WD40/YVTN/BNR-like repeat-containing protein, partial [Actinomycetota bacterium]
NGIAHVRLSTSSDPGGRNFVFTEQSLAYSEDGLSSLVELPTPWWANTSTRDTHRLSDLAVTRDSLMAAVNGGGSRRGLWISGDRGESWTRAESPLFAKDVGNIFATEDRVFLSLADQGLLCSTDLGRTWSKACTAPSHVD